MQQLLVGAAGGKVVSYTSQDSLDLLSRAAVWSTRVNITHFFYTTFLLLSKRFHLARVSVEPPPPLFDRCITKY